MVLFFRSGEMRFDFIMTLCVTFEGPLVVVTRVDLGITNAVSFPMLAVPMHVNVSPIKNIFTEREQKRSKSVDILFVDGYAKMN